MKVVVIGGVAGGASAAARLRRLDDSAQIVVLERGGHPSFANCGLPYYIGGQIASRDKLLVAPASMLRERHRLDVRVRQEAIAIDREAKRVRVREAQTGREYDEPYDKLILSPGAAPIVPPIDGAQLPGVHTLRNLEDADRLHQASAQGQRAVIVGGGFIGLELAENLVHRGVKTTVVQRGEQVLTPWDAEMVATIGQTLRDHSVDLRLNDELTRIEPADGALLARTSRGAELSVDFVAMAVGVRPESRLAEESGLAVSERGGIVVDPQMRTSDPNIFAVGDAVQVTHTVTGEATQVPLAGPANRQGRIAADACCGRETEFRGVQSTAVVGVFDKTAAMTGLSEKGARSAGLSFEKVYVHPSHHAGYYPGAEGMTLKLLFDPDTGRVLGAQAVGGEGVDKRIDVVSMAIQGGMTVYDLEEAELCYAPQYGSAKDPINMAGMVAAGVLRGDQPVTHADALLDAAPDARPFLLDVRTPREFADGAIPDAVNIPVDDLRERLDEVPRDRPVVAYCKVGMRGYLATRVLQQAGHSARNLSGGYTTHQQFVAARELATV